jgi:hypothetical protein
MVDVQSISIVLAALSFVVAVTYYAMNIMEIRRSRRITLTTTLMQPFMTVEGNREFGDLLTMEWSDLDDYNSKYDSRVSLENWAKRVSVWKRCDSLGLLYRKGLLDLETIGSGSLTLISDLWYKFKPVIEMYRKTDFHRSAFENWEYLAEKLQKAYPATVSYEVSESWGFKKETEP